MLVSCLAGISVVCMRTECDIHPEYGRNVVETGYLVIIKWPVVTATQRADPLHVPLMGYYPVSRKLHIILAGTDSLSPVVEFHYKGRASRTIGA